MHRHGPDCREKCCGPKALGIIRSQSTPKEVRGLSLVPPFTLFLLLKSIEKAGAALMKRKLLLIRSTGFFLLALGLALLNPFANRADFSWAEQAMLLGDKHKEMGIQCESCHKENPPQNKVPKAVCQGCHGDYKMLAEKTEKVDPNPHRSHEGNLDCSVCHHSHKPSEDHCESCHNFGFKVP
jgi:hypothetical protein